MREIPQSTLWNWSCLWSRQTENTAGTVCRRNVLLTPAFAASTPRAAIMCPQLAGGDATSCPFRVEIVSWLWGVANRIRDNFKRGKHQDARLFRIIWAVFYDDAVHDSG